MLFGSATNIAGDGMFKNYWPLIKKLVGIHGKNKQILLCLGNKKPNGIVGCGYFHSVNQYEARTKDKKLITSACWSPFCVNLLCFYCMKVDVTDYRIIWKKPEKIPSWRSEISGDLSPLEDIDQTLPRVEFKSIENEVAKCDPRTRDLLSVGFGNKWALLKAAEYNMIRKVQEHKYDFKSHEAVIARLTARIRFFQTLIPKFPEKTRMRVALQERIDKRNKKLRHLRRVDYKKFEWLLEELNIIFRPIPRDPISVTRKNAYRQLVDLHCEKIMESKLERYKNELELLKEPFLKEKLETLKWIVETEKRLGLPVSVEVPDDLKLVQLPDIEATAEVTKDLSCKLNSESAIEGGAPEAFETEDPKKA